MASLGKRADRSCGAGETGLDGFYETVLQSLRSWVPKAPQLSKSGSAIADAGIDTTVLPQEQLPSDRHLEPELQQLPQLESDEGLVPARSAGEDLVANSTLPTGFDEELVSWDSQEANVVQERTEGLPANEHQTIDTPV